MNKKILGIAIVFLASLASPLSAAEQQGPTIAVAANFMGAMEKIADSYEEDMGEKLQIVFSSTGKLYAQIKNGAPYDLFLAADSTRPELLAEAGFCAEPFVYGIGEVILWTSKSSFSDEENWQNVILSNEVKRISVSTPETAPYGAAVFSSLERKGLLKLIKDKLVYGHNVAQAFQFAFHGSTDLGFIALSLALTEKGRQGFYWRVPEAEKIVQKGCVVKGRGKEETVTKFVKFFRQESTKNILKDFGYK